MTKLLYLATVVSAVSAIMDTTVVSALWAVTDTTVMSVSYISLGNGYGHDRRVLAVRNYGHDGRVRNTDLFGPKPPSTRVLPVRPSESYSSPRPDLNRPDMYLSCIFSVYAYTTLSS